MVKWTEISNIPGIIKRFRKNPVKVIISAIGIFFANLILDIGRLGIYAVRKAFQPLVSLPGDLGRIIGAGFAPVGALLFELSTLPVRTITGLTEPLGPWQPFIQVPLYVLTIVALAKVADLVLTIVSPRVSESLEALR